LKCKQCVAEVETEEREAAAARRAIAASGDDDNDQAPAKTVESRECALCHKTLPQSDYNRNQWSKGVTKSKCRTCVETAIQQEESQQEQAKQQKINAAKQAVVDAQASGKVAAIIKAESIVAALEAEQVTGLKPVKTRGGRGRGGSSGRGGRGGRGRGPR
jgi:hypothetical protein